MSRSRRLVNLCIIISLIGLLINVPKIKADTTATVTGPHGADNIRSPKGVCANCHIPHYGTGPKIWAQPLANTFDGVRRLCYSCHDGTFVCVGSEPEFKVGEGIPWPTPTYSDYSVSGINDVFDPEKYEDHVMHGAANITPDDWLGIYDSETFPLDPDDKDTVPKSPADMKYRQGGDGFYCGSCHNVHQQPIVNGARQEDGDYLRTKEENGKGLSVGSPGERRDFCVQCHNSEHISDADQKNIHLYNTRCLPCHHPHKGYTLVSEDLSPEDRISRAIFVFPVNPIPFIAKPNVSKINDDENTKDINKFPSFYCYACHQPHHLNGGEDNELFLRAGAAPIFGEQRRSGIDDDKYITSKSKEHHPMGIDALKRGEDGFLRADGEATTYLNDAGELTCTSCHSGLHGASEESPGMYMDYRESKKNNFLRWNFKDDDATFCIKCHSNKGVLTQEDENTNHFWKNNAPVPKRDVFESTKFNAGDLITAENYKTETYCRQCMLCHFIHDGERTTDTKVLTADINSLMRVAPKNPFLGTNDPYRNNRSGNNVYYEDMCFGCHTNSAIVAKSNDHNALLSFTLTSGSLSSNVFSHRYAISNLQRNNPPFKAMAGDDFPIADGDGDNQTAILDDYGTNNGEMYCGSCHDVHDPTRGPYLHYSSTSDKSDEFYKPYGFCEDCHNSGNNSGVQKGDFCDTTHPIDKGPNNSVIDGSPTVYTFPTEFTSGGSGKEDGQVYGSNNKVVCLTCHNVHAAKTTYDGSISAQEDGYFHGKLLVKDNFENKSGNGSELCKACHSSLVKDGDVNDFPEGNHGKLIYAKNNYGDQSNLQGGICSACHIPHNTIGPKIWSREGYPGYGEYSINEAPFLGYRQLCFTCHNSSGGQKSVADTGAGTVFKDAKLGDSSNFCVSCDPNGLTMDHVMHASAKVDLSSSKVLYLKAGFGIDKIPRDFNDTDTIPCVDAYNQCAGIDDCDGFYCGSCHNPHDQPGNETAVGNYLRAFIPDGLVSNKSQFCEQCHEIDAWHAHDTIGKECSDCHMVHGAPTRACANDIYARDILTDKLITDTADIGEYWPFRISVNLRSKDTLDTSTLSASALEALGCISCHRIGGGAGDAPINFNMLHHPMGTYAKLPSENSTFLHAEGTPKADLKDLELACKTCHTADCEEGTNSITAIRDCIKCHNDKRLIADDAKDKLLGKHLVSLRGEMLAEKYTALPQWEKYKLEPPCSPCMFCHFIHNNTPPVNYKLGDTRAEVDCLMRVGAVNLWWGQQYKGQQIDTDNLDYEDLCFGCHGNSKIVGGLGDNGSLLNKVSFASHRFAIPRTQITLNSPTLDNMSSNKEEVDTKKKFPLADGPGNSIIDDYGTINSQFYCGSCHNVHNGNNGPYLRSIIRPGYLDTPNVNKGFCEACHDDGNKEFCDINTGYIHPVDKGPNPPVTVNTWPTLYTSAGSGKAGGIVTSAGNIICLTCHNVHACATTWDNNLPQKLANDIITVQGHEFPKRHGKLLVRDNYSKDIGSKGSDMCIDCHKTAIE